jgi:hypothetical protein
MNIVVEGQLDNNIRMQILRAIADESNDENCVAAIIDLRQSTFNPAEPIEGAVKLAMHMSDLGISPNTKLALVYKGAKVHRATFEKVTQKIGYQLRYFKTPNDAHLWFNYSATPPGTSSV